MTYWSSQPLTAPWLEGYSLVRYNWCRQFRTFICERSFCEKNDDKIYKAWVTIYKCSSTRVILFDLVPRPDSTSFINSFCRMIARRGYPNNIISDNGKNFISGETQFFATNLGINWDLNLPLAPRHVFERLIRSTKYYWKMICKIIDF